MAKVDLIMPKMGESITEATILKWVKNVGDKVEEDEPILEIATDKVDSEIPSPVDGVIVEILHQVDEVVEVGKVIAVIKTEGEESSAPPQPATPEKAPEKTPDPVPAVAPVAQPVTAAPKAATVSSATITTSGQQSNRFYSPLVKSIANKENISFQELETVPGTGAKGRVTKKDILKYVSVRGNGGAPAVMASMTSNGNGAAQKVSAAPIAPVAPMSGEDEIIEMGRMRKLIADHMVMSKQTSPHVTSFVEADVTNIVKWRTANKAAYQAKYGEKITFTPLIMEAVVKAIKDFPMINVSVVDGKIHVKKNINVGMAAALPSGNLIVPVIKNADYLNLAGLTRQVNDLATRARANKLKPDDIQGGTFTLTNVGTFGNVMGTPIINQPQVAILAAGAIRKKPAVVETEYGDLIAIRHQMFLSHSYDHRVVDGFLGGSFVRRVADYLEGFDVNRTI